MQPVSEESLHGRARISPQGILCLMAVPLLLQHTSRQHLLDVYLFIINNKTGLESSQNHNRSRFFLPFLSLKDASQLEVKKKLLA